MARRALVVLLALLALVPAACGGGEDDVPAGGNTATEEAPVNNERPDQTEVPGPNDESESEREQGRE